jgi:hypothetical protein
MVKADADDEEYGIGFSEKALQAILSYQVRRLLMEPCGVY